MSKETKNNVEVTEDKIKELEEIAKKYEIAYFKVMGTLEFLRSQNKNEEKNAKKDK